jgi:hypothetical protein
MDLLAILHFGAKDDYPACVVGIDGWHLIQLYTLERQIWTTRRSRDQKKGGEGGQRPEDERQAPHMI